MKRRKIILPPAPPRRLRPVSPDKPSLPADEWLDMLDPKRTRHLQPVTVWVRSVTKEDAREWLLHVPEYQRTRKQRSLKDFEADMREGY